MSALTQRSGARGEISPALRKRADLALYPIAFEAVENFQPLKEGGNTRRSGTRYLGDVHAHAVRGRLVPFVFGVTESHMIEFGDQVLRIWVDDGVVESAPGVPLTVATPYSADELAALQVVQSADVLWIVHGNHRPRELQRLSATSWQLVPYEPANGPFDDLNPDDDLTIEADGVDGEVTLTADGFTFGADLVGAEVQIVERDLGATPQWLGDTDYTAGEKVRVFGKTYEATADGNSGANPPQHDYGVQSSGTGFVSWRYLHDGIGIAKITAVAPGGATATATVSKRLPDSLQETASPAWSFSAWSDAKGWPAAVGMHQGRLVFARTATYPNRLWTTKAGDFGSMEAGGDDDEAMILQLASGEVNAIQWLASRRVLAVGTEGREWSIAPSALREALTPENRNAEAESDEGSAPVQAIVIGSAVVFVSADRERLHEYVWSIEEDGFVSPDLSQSASHITERGVERLAWARDEQSLWVQLTDGGLASLTYRRAEQVAAWARHPMNNAFVESIAVKPTTDGRKQGLWLIVRRTIDGEVRRYVEVMQPRYRAGADTDARNAWMLDCALRYDGAAATEISGLDHLEGETVQILADGKALPPQTVAGGAITLTQAAGKVLVGLGYVARLKTLSVDLGEAGSIASRPKKVTGVTVHTLASVGGQAAYADATEELAPSGGGIMNQASPLVSGVASVRPYGSGWEKETSVEVRQSQPLPLTVLAITLDFEIGERR